MMMMMMSVFVKCSRLSSLNERVIGCCVWIGSIRRDLIANCNPNPNNLLFGI